MRTLIDIQDELINELLREAKTTVKKEAITSAIRTYLEVKRREKLASLIGNYEFGYMIKDLEEMREDG
ncbi:MAG: type II toxin-antitoxin system VapB family antitoxin [Desulfobacteria bacterium]